MHSTILRRAYTADLADGGIEVVLGAHTDTIGAKYFVGIGDYMGPMSSSDYYDFDNAEIAFKAELTHYGRRSNS